MLLLANDCVVVPGLGGFVAHHVAARYDDGEHLFLPPLRAIGFNPKLTMNDSLLAQSYVEAHDVSYPEAMLLIERDVNELKQRLERDGCYELGGVGVLQLNDDGRYEFEPCEAGVLTPALYGLYSFGMDALEPAVRGAAAAGGGVTAAAEPSDERQPAARRQSLTTSIMVTAAAAVVLVMLFLSPNPIELSNRTELMSMFGLSLHRPQKAPEAQPSSAVVKAVAEPSVKAVTEPSVAPAGSSSVTEATADEGVQQPRPAPYYTVVLACKIPLKNARAYAERLTADGYDGVSVLGDTGNLKVVCGEYATQNEAYNALRRMRQGSTAFADAWVYRVRSK